jgi:3-mercaptopyruvate sulfurtransferase SseA
VALQLKARGILQVRPLQGGLDAWKTLSYPLEDPERRILRPMIKTPS